MLKTYTIYGEKYGEIPYDYGTYSELVEDLKAYHTIDAKEELSKMLSDQISININMDIATMLQKAIASTKNYSIYGVEL